MYTDASGEVGCGAVCNTEWLQVKWSGSHAAGLSTTQKEVVPIIDALILGSAYRISAYQCAIACIGIEQIVADTADYRVAHAQTIYSTDQIQVIMLTRFTRVAHAFSAAGEHIYR